MQTLGYYKLSSCDFVWCCEVQKSRLTPLNFKLRLCCLLHWHWTGQHRADGPSHRRRKFTALVPPLCPKATKHLSIFHSARPIFSRQSLISLSTEFNLKAPHQSTFINHLGFVHVLWAECHSVSVLAWCSWTLVDPVHTTTVTTVRLSSWGWMQQRLSSWGILWFPLYNLQSRHELCTSNDSGYNECGTFFAD